MKEEPQSPSEVLGGLPHRRPNRRSQKRGNQPPDGDGGPGAPESTASPTVARAAPNAPSGREIVGTMVQAAAELAEIGLSVSVRAVREAVARLPRP